MNKLITDSKEGLHTQGEWYINNATDDDGEVIIKTNPQYGNQKYFTLGIKGSFDFVGFLYPSSKQTDSEMIANAELIVKAVNERKALLDALNDMIGLIKPYENNLTVLGHGVLRSAKSIIDKAKNVVP